MGAKLSAAPSLPYLANWGWDSPPPPPPPPPPFLYTYILSTIGSGMSSVDGALSHGVSGRWCVDVRPYLTSCVCPPGPLTCLRDPCLGASCPAHPAATCYLHVCGTCRPLWFLDNRIIDCTPPRIEGKNHLSLHGYPQKHLKVSMVQKGKKNQYFKLFCCSHEVILH